MIAAKVSQDTSSSRYRVVSNLVGAMASIPSGQRAPVGRVETNVPGPSIEPTPVNSEVAEGFTSQAGCITGGMFDACPGFMDLMYSRREAWPHWARAELPAANAPLTAASVPHAMMASVGEKLGLFSGDVGESFDRLAAKTGEVIIGTASLYNPYDKDDNDAGGAETASGELYDPIAWTAAIQIDLRDKFAGVRYGRLYEPRFALVELNGKRAIVKINDVGPLRPGRVIDFSQQTMHYFDPTLQLGVLDGVLVTPLIGSDWTPGPAGTTSAVAVASSGP